jgi:hypothetical protein
MKKMYHVTYLIDGEHESFQDIALLTADEVERVEARLVEAQESGYLVDWEVGKWTNLATIPACSIRWSRTKFQNWRKEKKKPRGRFAIAARSLTNAGAPRVCPGKPPGN